MSALFVTGAGTEIGKTYVSCAVLQAWRTQGAAVSALKPIVSGYDIANIEESDPALLLAAQGQSPTTERIAAIAPWRFKAPLAPPLAARAENAIIAFEEVVEFCSAQMRATQGALLIEGAGGVMAPLTDAHTNLELIVELAIPVLFVAGSYLGAVSHALTGLEALRTRGAKVAAIIVSESHESVGLGDTCGMIETHAHAPIIAAARGETAWASRIAPP